MSYVPIAQRNTQIGKKPKSVGRYIPIAEREQNLIKTVPFGMSKYTTVKPPEIGMSKYTPIKPPYKSPTSLTYTPQEPIQKGVEAIQKFGEPIQTITQSPLMRQAQKAGTEIVGGIRKPLEAVAETGKFIGSGQLVENISKIPAVQNVINEVVTKTSGTGIVAAFNPNNDKTFQEAYDALREKQAGDPSKFNQFLYQLGDSAPQTAIGVALNFIPIAGKALSSIYWSALSANEQIQKKGKVTSMENIFTDVAGDRMLGNSIQALFKAPAKTLLKTMVQSFAVEGGTEVAQDLIKYSNDYARAKTPEEKQATLDDVKEYFTSGQILITAGVGGISGAAVGTGAYTINLAGELYKSQTPKEKQAGFIKLPIPEGLPKIPETGKIEPLSQEANKPVSKIEPTIEEQKTILEVRKEALASSPLASPNNRFFVDREGRILELGDLKTKKLIKRMEDRMSEAGITDPQEFSTRLEGYFKRQKLLNEAVKDLQQAIKDIKSEQILNNLSDSIAIHNEKMIEFSRQNPKLSKLIIDMSEEMTVGAKKGFKLGYQVRDILAKKEITETRVQTKLEVKEGQERLIRKEQLKTIRVGITERIKGIEKGKREGKIMTKAEVKANQEEIIKLLNESNLEAVDKAKFIPKMKNVQTQEQLEKASPEIRERIESLEQSEFKRGIIRQIEKELKRIKPVKKGTFRVSRYDYETNKFLQNLKDISKYTQEKAQEELAKSTIENLSRADLIKNRLLSFKAGGAKSSTALLSQVLADIQDLKALGEEAKDELDFQKKLERQEKKDEILEGIKNQIESWGVLKPFKKAYVSSVSNLYSAINTIAGKDIADKYDYGMYQTNSKQDAFVKTEEFKSKAKELYGVKSDRQLTKIFISDLAKKDYKITDIEELSEDISKFDLMNIYNGMKNELIEKRYYNFFGEEQINSLLQNLTPEDAQLADYLMEEVQSYKDILNQRSIEIKGMDNGTVENYWPSVSEYMPEFFDDIKIQGEMPSATKERSKSSKVIPKMANAWVIAQKHIAEAEHVKTVSRKYEELKNLFSDRTIKKTIEAKYGNDTYQALMKHIETFSLNYRTEGLDIVSGVYNSALNNWVRAKVASPTVFARQMISSIYSIESVGIKNFAKYQTEFATNPKKAFDYMWDNIPFIKNRFKMGYSEALEDVIRGTKKMSIGMDSITQYTTLMTRGGDVTAIMINGYPIIKTEMAKHGNMEKAIEVFLKFSEKTQQSPSRANMSDLQRNRGAWHKTFFRFKNTTNQLLRLQVDANIQFVNKQISAKDYATKTLLYSVYTPIMYVLMGFMITQGWKALFGTDDEEKKDNLLGDFLQNIIVQPFQAIPFLDMATEWTYSKTRQKITGKKLNYGMFSYPLFDDIERAGFKLFKKEPSAMDFLEVLSLIQEPMTGIPTETVLRYYGYTQEKKKAKSKSTKTKIKIPSGLPQLPSLKKRLPQLRGLPKLRRL